MVRDGQVWVLLSHRSPHVQRGGTWPAFGGAIDVGETAWRAAVRETCEEIRGITPDQAGIAGEAAGTASGSSRPGADALSTCQQDSAAATTRSTLRATSTPTHPETSVQVAKSPLGLLSLVI